MTIEGVGTLTKKQEELFKLVFELPEPKRSKAIQMVKEYIEEQKNNEPKH